MADDAKIRIPIDIPAGDISGAATARQEIEQTKQAAATASAQDIALEKQRADDVIEARRRVSERRIEEQQREIALEKEAQLMAQDTARLRLAAGAALAASARQVAALTVDVIRQYKELGVEIGGFEELGLQFADFLTSPIESTIDAFTGYKEELRLLQEGQREVIRSEQVLQAAIAKRNAELEAASRRRIDTFLAGERAAIDEQTKAYERQLRVVQAVAAEEEARAQAADRLALARGGDPQAIAAGAAARQAAAAGTVQDQRVLAAEQQIETAIRTFEGLTSALAQANAAAVRDPERIAQLSQQTQEAQDAIRDAQAELETVRVEAAAAKAEIAAGAVSEFQGIATAAADANLAAAEEAKAALQAQAAQQGENFAAGGREALRILSEAVADREIKPEELSAITQAINQAKGASTRLNADVLEGFQALEKTNATAIEAIRDLNTRLNVQAQQIQALQAQISAGN